jgi:DNA mismatch endonuclease, patch repair protein
VVRSHTLTPSTNRWITAAIDSITGSRLRSALHSGGHRFRKDFLIRVDRRVVRPDIAFTRLRIAVFVDGCFWHVCPLHGEIPATNVAFWTTKLEGDVARDLRQNELLTGQPTREAAGQEIFGHLIDLDAVRVVVAAFWSVQVNRTAYVPPARVSLLRDQSKENDGRRCDGDIKGAADHP